MTQFNEYFSPGLVGNFLKGQEARETFTDITKEFFEDFDGHVYISGPPGVGKTRIVETMSKKYPDVHLVTISGQMSAWYFAKQVAIEMYLADMKGIKNVAFHLDDLNTLFKHIELVDIFKAMLDTANGGLFSYNKGINMGSLEDLEAEAIQYFKDKNPNKAGFQIEFKNRVKFIMTMNTPLPTSSDAAKIKVGTPEYIKANNLSALTSRFGDGYEDLTLSKEQMWGWISYVVWTDPEMCKGATWDQRYEILQYLWDGWEKCNERSLRFVENTMWKIMKKKPLRKEYTHRWSRHFTTTMAGKMEKTNG